MEFIWKSRKLLVFASPFLCGGIELEGQEKCFVGLEKVIGLFASENLETVKRKMCQSLLLSLFVSKYVRSTR